MVNFEENAEAEFNKIPLIKTKSYCILYILHKDTYCILYDI